MTASGRRARTDGRRLTILMVGCLGLIALRPAAAHAPEPPRGPKTIRVDGTLEAAIGQPMVDVQLRDGERVVRGKPGPLDELLGDDKPRDSFPAFLDTGASGFVISRSTTGRFGIVAADGAAYEEVGLHGTVVMGVSEPYDVFLMGAPGSDALQGGRKARLLLNRAEQAAGLMSFMPALDVIGMPAIERLVVEMEPGPSAERFRLLVRGGGGAEALLELAEAAGGTGFGPAVRLHPRGHRVRGGDITISLEYRDFNPKKGRRNRGVRPALADNPLVPAVTVEHGGRTATGDWLLDTGAAASIVSTAHAKTLGLVDVDGRPTREPDFTLPLGGVGGVVETAPGFIVERLRVPAGRGTILEFTAARVVVRDIGVELTPGQTVVLDGVFGMNLLLPSARGLGGLGGPGAGAGAIEVSDPPFKRIWIDGGRRRLVLER